MRREPREEPVDILGRFDKLFEEWAQMLLFRPMGFPFWWGAADMIHVEEYWEDGMLVVCADLPGIEAPVQARWPDGTPSNATDHSAVSGGAGDPALVLAVNAVNPVGSLGTVQSSLARPLAALLRGVDDGRRGHGDHRQVDLPGQIGRPAHRRTPR